MKDTIVDMATQPVEFVLSEEDFHKLASLLLMAFQSAEAEAIVMTKRHIMQIYDHLYDNIEMRVKR